MIVGLTSLKDFVLYRLGIIFLLSAFMLTSSGIWEVSQAQTIINLPAPGIMVPTSDYFNPLQLKGIQLHAKNPLQFDFLVDKGQSHLDGVDLKDEISRLTKYFLTCLTVPETDLWVNLSPYEKDRIAPQDFGTTQMGKDLLEQDYLLKQITATLSYPQEDLGRRFWLKMYEKAYKLYGTTNIPVNTFNKVWIVPKSADVYVRGNSAFITHSELDVMLDTDYLALRQNLDNSALGLNRVKNQDFNKFSQIYSQTVREVILPILRRDVNQGKNFAIVRQVYDSMILATWYKRHLKDGFLGQIYIGQNKVVGVDVDDKTVKEKIFQQYLRSFKKHVYNYISEDYDPFTNQTIARKYVSGGFTFVNFGMLSDKAYVEKFSPEGLRFNGDLAMATIDLDPIKPDGALMNGRDLIFSYEHSQAMLSHLPKFMKNCIVGIMFAIGFAAVSPTALKGATFTPSQNGAVVMHVEDGDQLGRAMEKIRLTYNKVSPKEYKASAYSGNLYTALNKVINLEDKDHIKRPQEIPFIEPLPQSVVEALPGYVAKAVQSNIVVPLPVQLSPKPSPKPLPAPATAKQMSVPSPAVLPVSAKPAPRVVSAPVLAHVPAADAKKAPMTVNEVNEDDPEKIFEKSIKQGLSAPVISTGVEKPAVTVPAAVATKPASFNKPVPVYRAPVPALTPPTSVNVVKTKPIVSTVTTGVSEDDPEKIFEMNSQLSLPQANARVEPTQQVVIGLQEHKEAPAETLNNDDGDPENIFQRNQDQEQTDSTTAIIIDGQTSQSKGTGAPPPPEKENPWSLGKAFLGLGVLLSIAGLGRYKGYALPRFLTGKVKKKLSVDPVVPAQVPLAPVVQPSTNGTHYLDVTLPPPAALAGEAQILAEDLAKLRDIADGKIPPPPPIPAEEDEETAGIGGPKLKWMDWGALLGGLALSVSLGGSLPLILARMVAIPFVVRGLYVAQRTFHEKFHLLAASLPFVYFKKMGEIWSGRNLRENLSLGQWVKSLIPFTRSQRPIVNLPFANVKDSWIKNKFISWSGLAGSIGLVGLAGYLMGMTPLFGLVALSALPVLKGSLESGDLFGSSDTDEGRFPCGIIGFVRKIPIGGEKRKNLDSWFSWYFKNMDDLTVRGGQQGGFKSNVLGMNDIEKITKEKRNWFIWQNWDKGPVFYRNMIKVLHDRVYKKLPRWIVTGYNYGKNTVVKALGHVRFATGGIMRWLTAHPFGSPQSKRKVWVYDAVRKTFRKVVRIVEVISAFNGDHDGSKIGIPYRPQLNQRYLSFANMRSFYPAAVHKYYEGRVTLSYLKENVIDAEYQDQGGYIPTNHAAIRRLLYEKGYIDFWGNVNHEFKGLDQKFKEDYINEEFKKENKKYKEKYLSWSEPMFNSVESALFGMPPGDAVLLPLEHDLDLTQGDWFASARYAHVMANHRKLEEARDDILFEKQGRAVGEVFSEVYDQVEPFITRRGYNPQDPDAVRSLNDCYVKDEKTAKELGLEGQYEMIKLFKQMLYQRIKEEAEQEKTLAGKIFRQWELKWLAQGEDPKRMLRIYIDLVVEKFFTADNVAATKEFAESSDGTYGLYYSSTLDDSITLYQDNQDVIVGINEAEGYFGFASTPLVLKSLGSKGEKFDKVIHLQDGEVANVSFSPTGKIIFRTWMRIGGEWKETPKEELDKRFYPTAEFYVDKNGVEKKNPYYAPPQVKYKNPRRMVQEGLENTPRILADAQKDWENPDSFNNQSLENLTESIIEGIKKNGRARLVLIGYDNSFKLSKQFKTIIGRLIERGTLTIDAIDANKFNETPSRYRITSDDIVMVVSKSGATFSSKLALRLLKNMVGLKNIFCMTARIDSVLATMIGQGLRPGEDEFTKRVFLTGEFYPSETPMESEVLLMFQMQQLGINLMRRLKDKNDSSNSLGLKPLISRIDYLASKITEDSIRMAQELTGFDLKGKVYENANKRINGIGIKLGKYALKTFKANWLMKFFVGGVLLSPSFLIDHYLGLGSLGTVLNVTWITCIVPFLISETYNKIIGRPAFSRDAPFDLFIAGPPVIASTQRNYFSRILTNRLKSIGPAAIYAQDPTTDFVADYASDQKRGDVDLKFSFAHKRNQGRMGVNQATYPRTAIFGTSIIQGGPEIIDAVIDVPYDEDASKEEIQFLEDSEGALLMMIAAKKIQVEMAKIASWDGRLFNLSSTFSSAGVHTTQINAISEEARKILDSGREKALNGHTVVLPFKVVDIGNKQNRPKGEETELVGSHAMTSLLEAHHPGGITMNNRLMKLKITGDIQSQDTREDSALLPLMITGVIPQVSGVITVTPGMLKNILGVGYQN